MATKIKKPGSMRSGAPARPAPEDPRQSAGPSRQQQQAANRPEYESQVPGLVDLAGLEQLAAGARGGAAAGGRIAIPETLKRKTKVRKKSK